MWTPVLVCSLNTDISKPDKGHPERVLNSSSLSLGCRIYRGIQLLQLKALCPGGSDLILRHMGLFPNQNALASCPVGNILFSSSVWWWKNTGLSILAFGRIPDMVKCSYNFFFFWVYKEREGCSLVIKHLPSILLKVLSLVPSTEKVCAPTQSPSLKDCHTERSE